MNKIITLSLYLISTFVMAASPKSLNISLNLDPNPSHTPLLIAEKLGFFKEEGLNVRIMNPSSPHQSSQLLTTGKVDIAITNQPEFMMQVDQGLPLISIGTLIDKPMNCLVTMKDGNIKSIADLKGKKIASNNDLSTTLLKRMLRLSGLTEKDVQIVNLRNNTTQALLTHQIDAVNGISRNVDVPEMEARDQKLTAFLPEDHGVPSYNELIFVINKGNLKDPRFSHFLSAIKKSVAWIDEHPREAWDIFIQRHPAANTAMNRDTWFATLPYFAEEPGEFNEPEWKQFAKFMHENKLIKKNLPVSEYAVELR